MPAISIKYPTKIFIALFVLFVFLSPVSAEIYKWKDKDGNVFYSDSPPSGVGVEVKKFRQDRIERPETKDEPTKPTHNTSKEKRPVGDISVIMYMTSWCPYCRKARDYINSIGTRLTEYDIETDKNSNAEMLRKSGGSKGVPLIDIEGIIIRGYIPAVINAAVEKRRNSAD